MDFEFNSQLTQVQRTVITQKLIEHLEILQMTSLELTRHIDEMLNTNPLLECEISESDQEFEGLQKNLGEYPHRFDSIRPKTLQEDDFLSYSKSAVTLREYLKHQLLELRISLKYRKIANYLIENLDVDGYLRESVCELCNGLQVSERDVKYSLKILQSLEPAGVGARDIKECLILQLKRKKIYDRSIENIITHYFDLIACRNFLRISRETSLTRQKVEQISTLIKSLNPKPGCTFRGNEWEQYIVPDIILSKVDGMYILEFNDESIPSVRINSYYTSLMRSPESSSEVKNYIKRNLSGAEWWIKVIEQRKTTILNVANCIVDFQKDFFERGSEYLKPLTMKMVAESLGIHVSTVSRTVHGKYMQTPRGVYTLKFFFSSTVEAEFENNMSAVSVKNMVKKIVQEEDKSEPLSDEQVKRKLECIGVKIARRTVAKYREELLILPSAQRKCWIKSQSDHNITCSLRG